VWVWVCGGCSQPGVSCIAVDPPAYRTAQVAIC